MTPLLDAGVELMLIGMGTVFFFLTLLVFATGLMSRLVMRYAPAVAGVVGSVDRGDEEEVAAISVAIAEHRRKNNHAD
jgi:oxaloacetate decarboxylase gamma subunit